MEELNYSIDNKTAAELLGIQNFSNAESAILELVKNSFDAKSLSLEIKFSPNKIELSDNGVGMSKDDIVNYWMNIGKSNKKYRLTDSNHNSRVLSGSKGIGRFALARLGNKVILESKKKNNKGVVWSTDWNKNSLEINSTLHFEGTKISITNLREKWTKTKIKKLSDYLTKSYRDNVMSIFVIDSGNQLCHNVGPFFPKVQLGQNCKSKIELSFSENILNIDIESKEFDKSAIKYCKGIDLEKHNSCIDVFNELKESDIFAEYDMDIKQIRRTLKEVGAFSALFYFNNQSSNEDKRKFMYRSAKLIDAFKSGVVLYRNSFSISSYEGNKDWLCFGKRSRKSPAAASHPTGSWRVRENQISGYVLIDKKENKYLIDLSNRQSLEENIYYKVFIEIILLGVREFERYRQNIIRLIDKKNKIQLVETKLYDNIITRKKKFEDLTVADQIRLISEMIEKARMLEEYKNLAINNEKRFGYDVRILNALATSGMKAVAFAHEVNNKRNDVDSSYNFIVDALKKYGFWDKLNSPEYTEYADENVPKLLKDNDDAYMSVLRLMDVMLDNIEVNKFNIDVCNVSDLIEKIVDPWIKEYNWINVRLRISNGLIYTGPIDIFTTIFDNLILNSIQQNSKLGRLNILISITEIDNLLKIRYRDDGVGLHNKYKRNPWVILEPHETTRKNGHGLGMWIVNNTINVQNGQITKIGGDDGFCIDFSIRSYSE